MATITKAWLEQKPAGSDKIRLSDDMIRDNYVALRERFHNMGAEWESGAAPSIDAAAGRLTCGRQGTTGVWVGPYDAAGTTGLATYDDGTGAAGKQQLVLGDGRGGAAPTELEVEDIVADTVDCTATITGDAVVATTTLTMPTNTVHNFEATRTAANLTLTASAYTQAAAVTITTAGGIVLIEWTGSILCLGTVTQFDFQIERAASPIETILLAGNGSVNDQVNFAVRYVDTSPGTGSVTYNIDIKPIGANGQLGATSPHVLTALELRNA